MNDDAEPGPDKPFFIDCDSEIQRQSQTETESMTCPLIEITVEAINLIDPPPPPNPEE
jgi:hypothetical protein